MQRAVAKQEQEDEELKIINALVEQGNAIETIATIFNLPAKK